jgi:CHAD domain-containing protein
VHPICMQEGDRDDRFLLVREESAAAGMIRIAAGRAETALRRLGALAGGEEDAATAVHAARKDLKKVRTVLRLVRAQLPKKVYRRQSRCFRDAGRALSASRDTEVRLATLTALEDRVRPAAAETTARWRAMLERDRDAAAESIAADAAIGEASALIEAGLAKVECWEVEGDSWRLIDEGTIRTYRRGRAAFRAASEDPSEAAIHEWRKRSKDLWYELRLLSAAWPRPMEAAAEEAHALSDLLGDHHDLALLGADLERRQFGPEPTRALEETISVRQRELAAAAISLGARLYAERPRAYRRRLRGYWRAWRR